MKTNYEVQSNKNGNSGSRGAGFSGRSASSYTITTAGQYAGEIVQTKDSRFNYKTTCWLVCLPGSTINGAQFQALKDAKFAIAQS